MNERILRLDKVLFARIEQVVGFLEILNLVVGVEEGTDPFALTVGIVAFDLLEVLDMILELFPAVTTLAKNVIWTAVHVAQYFVFGVPEGTHNRLLILEEGPLEVLPVVGIDAGETVVIDF